MTYFFCFYYRLKFKPIVSMIWVIIFHLHISTVNISKT